MSEATIDFRATTFSKTSAGLEEIQSRALKLAPLVRRLLVLVDGKRTGAELEPFVVGQSLISLMSELLNQGLVSMRTAPVPAAATSSAPATSALGPNTGNEALAALPPPEMRSAKDLEMARNFMTNTVNNIFGHHNRISLVEAIFGCKSSEELRGVYPLWATALESNTTGAKRLPEFREKLFAVL